MVRVTYDGEYLRGRQVTGEPVDWINVFPDDVFAGVGPRKDRYGNLRYWRVPNPTWGKQIDDGVGGTHEDTRRYLGMELAEQVPTEEQIKVVQDREIAARITLEYPIDEQIAELRKAVLDAGYPVSFQERAEDIKREVRNGGT